MSQVVYLTRTLTDVPADRGWLTPAERDIADGLRFDKRRKDWLLGRWTAKQALVRAAGQDDAALARWQVLPDEDRAPCVCLDGKRGMARVSLSHSNGAALCAVSPAGIAVGCDIEQIADRDAVFLETFFTAAERSAIDAAPDALRGVLTTLIWSAKESVLKLVRKGLSVDTWSVPVEPPALPLARDKWQPLRAGYTPDGETYDGWWRHDNRVVWTLFSAPGDGEPTSLDTNANEGRPDCVAGN